MHWSPSDALEPTKILANQRDPEGPAVSVEAMDAKFVVDPTVFETAPFDRSGIPPVEISML
jgi:hypothetical protein